MSKTCQKLCQIIKAFNSCVSKVSQNHWWFDYLILKFCQIIKVVFPCVECMWNPILLWLLSTLCQVIKTGGPCVIYCAVLPRNLFRYNRIMVPLSRRNYFYSKTAERLIRSRLYSRTFDIKIMNDSWPDVQFG
jgi:hypothetical protein